jgi:hypothetical protein
LFQKRRRKLQRNREMQAYLNEQHPMDPRDYERKRAAGIMLQEKYASMPAVGVN